MYPVRLLRNRLIATSVARNLKYYATHSSLGEAHSEQLRLLNIQWPTISRTVPYYHDLKRRNRLPDSFSSWHQFLELMPVVTRQDAKQHLEAMSSTARPAEWTRKTGGSTASPLQIPAWRSENRVTTSDIWLARSWFDVSPLDRLFMIWGHSHLLGKGVRGYVQGMHRRLLDRVGGIYRFSAYNLSDDRMRAAADELIRFRPQFIIGYSVALDWFARTNAHRTDLSKIGVKVVTGAAEAWPHPDSESLLSKLFSAPVSMEYGSVETGTFAHRNPVGTYDVFWRSYFLEACEPGPQGGSRVRVTSLYPRCFPLIRYELGDEISLHDGDNGAGTIRFCGVMGRCNSHVTVNGGSPIHSEAFTHAIREFSEVITYQVVEFPDRIVLKYRSPSELSHLRRQLLQERLIRIHRSLGSIEIVHADSLEQSVAGKTPMIVRRAS